MIILFEVILFKISGIFEDKIKFQFASICHLRVFSRPVNATGKYQGWNLPPNLGAGEGSIEEFEVKVVVHQGSILSRLLFIIVLEALSCEFCCGVPWEDLYALDLVIIAESLEECVRRLLERSNGGERAERS